MNYSQSLIRNDLPLPRVLLVENNAQQVPRLWTALSDAGFQTEVVSTGTEAITAIAAAIPDLVVTNLHLPGLDGLNLIQSIRKSNPNIPVILMTESGNEDVAAAALAKGALSYIPLRYWETTLLQTIRNLIGLSRRPDLRHRRLLDSLQKTVSHFELGTRPGMSPGIVSYVCETLQLLQFDSPENLIRLCIALSEVLDNAIYHGNLELSSDLRKEDGDQWNRAISERLCTSPYKDRKVHIQTDLSRNAAVITVRDEGNGFDHRSVADPTDPDTRELPCGRGIFLMRAFIDEVRFNDRGNEVTLICNRRGDSSNS